jgi:hypothetical protein
MALSIARELEVFQKVHKAQLADDPASLVADQHSPVQWCSVLVLAPVSIQSLNSFK